MTQDLGRASSQAKIEADVAFYVSGHGFGHATRCSALIAAIRAQSDVAIAVRTEAPHWIFEQRTPGVMCSAAPIDIGMLQPNGLDLDLDATLAAHETFCADTRWEEAIRREATWIRAAGVRLVVADIPALAFAAADHAGVRAVGVSNFSWDWILGEYADSQPRWSPIIARYRSAYATADRLFRLPMHGDLSAFGHIIDAPLLVNRAQPNVAACRRAAGLTANENRRIVLVSFGGLGRGSVRFGIDDSLRDYLFLGVGPKPRGFPGDWFSVPAPSTVPHEQLIRACDAVLGKPGFSTVAEVIAHERRFLYLCRAGFRENDVLVRELGTGCAEMPRPDFETGNWRSHLDALFERPAPPAAPPTDGAECIARDLHL